MTPSRIDKQPNRPTREAEKRLREAGYSLIAGIDEAGRGCLAGPVTAAAVIMPETKTASWEDEVKDSKLLSPGRRDYLFQKIQQSAIAIGVGMVDNREIDRINILQATYQAMRNAITQMEIVPHYILIDHLTLPGIEVPQRGITNGDRLCFSIACASIIAKVTRDRLMEEMENEYPGYGLASNKGYGTAFHCLKLRELGPCQIHRYSFRPVQEARCLF